MPCRYRRGKAPPIGVARLTLGPNEPVRVEAGAMMAMSAGVTLAAKAEGGIMKSLKRAALGGESFFVSTYTAPPRAASWTWPPACPATSPCYEITPRHGAVHLRRAPGSPTT